MWILFPRTKCLKSLFNAQRFKLMKKYSITCIERPLKGSNERGLLQQVVFKCRFYYVDLRRVVVSEQRSLKAYRCVSAKLS